jgi:formylglycine-generating enzyme required for sulfatase activity
MRLTFGAVVNLTALAVSVTWATPALAGTLKCPHDSVKVGNVCIDLYEASVWQIPPSNTSLVKQVQTGKATLASLTAGGATQLSPAASCSPAYPANFPASGQWTPVLGSSPPSPGVYALSIPGVHPSACITWFQAAQACRLSGKRLLTNLEWQDAAAGTPDPGTDDGTSDCNIITAFDAVSTGSRSNCKSNWGVFDMVGNVDEWVADWADVTSSGCTNSTNAFGFTGTDDAVCFGGDGSTEIPSALLRGGDWFSGSGAGVFAVGTVIRPSDSAVGVGFRCAR